MFWFGNFPLSTNHAIYCKIVEGIFQQTIFGVKHYRTHSQSHPIPTQYPSVVKGADARVEPDSRASFARSEKEYFFPFICRVCQKNCFLFFLLWTFSIFDTSWQFWTQQFGPCQISLVTLDPFGPLWTPLAPFTLLDTWTLLNTCGHLDPFGDFGLCTLLTTWTNRQIVTLFLYGET